MIPKIQPPSENFDRAVAYNERKMNGEAGIRPDLGADLEGIEDGHVLATRNVPEGADLVGEFDRLRANAEKKRRRGPRIQNVGFHMSINPGLDDRVLSEKEAVEMIDEIMERLGYAGQPYRIYKHTDTGRMHYHVASCRIGQDGKKIPADFERIVLRNVMKGLQDKYGFSLILTDEERKEQQQAREQEIIGESLQQYQTYRQQAEERTGRKKSGPDPQDPSGRRYVPPFERKSEHSVTRQIADACNDALRWHFSTFEQFQALLQRRYRILLEDERGELGEDRLLLSGTDRDGIPITPPLTEKDCGVNLLAALREKLSREKMRNRREQRERLEREARDAAAQAESFPEYRSRLEKKGIITVLSWTRDHQLFGITYLDRATRCAWKGSETAVDMKWLKATAGEKDWTLEEDKAQRRLEKRSRMPSRKEGPAAPEKKESSDRGAALRPPRLRVRGKGLKGLRDSGSEGSSAQAGAGPGERLRRDDDPEERPAELVK